MVGGVAGRALKPRPMATIEVSKTLVKSPPELWDELQGERLAEAIEGAVVRPSEPERTLSWEADGARGTAVLEPSGWGTKVTLTAEVEDVEEQVAESGFWGRLWPAGPNRHPSPTPPARSHPDLEHRLTTLLENLGQAHRQPFTRA